jgi:hypothetical protein
VGATARICHAPLKSVVLVAIISRRTSNASSKICYLFSAASARSSHSAAMPRNIARDFSSIVAVAKQRLA